MIATAPLRPKLFIYNLIHRKKTIRAAAVYLSGSGEQIPTEQDHVVCSISRHGGIQLGCHKRPTRWDAITRPLDDQKEGRAPLWPELIWAGTSSSWSDLETIHLDGLSPNHRGGCGPLQTACLGRPIAVRFEHSNLVKEPLMADNGLLRTTLGGTSQHGRLSAK